MLALEFGNADQAQHARHPQAVEDALAGHAPIGLDVPRFAYHERVGHDVAQAPVLAIEQAHQRSHGVAHGQRIQRVSLKDGDEIGVGLSRLVLQVDPGRRLK